MQAFCLDRKTKVVYLNVRSAEGLKNAEILYILKEREVANEISWQKKENKLDSGGVTLRVISEV